MLLRFFNLITPGAFGICLLVIYILSLLISAVPGVYLVFNFVLSPKRPKRQPVTATPATRFAIIIPARNEDRIIRYTIDQMKTLNYPANLYDILVIADNCTDHTAHIAEEAGAEVFIRKDLTRTSKAFALKWLFSHEKFIAKSYDVVCIHDADVVLDSEFLKFMDAEIQAGYEIVQGRCGSANPYDSFSTGFMTVLASVQTRLWYLPQANRGLSGFYIGTGTCITMKRIRETGWNISTLVEDAEFSIQSVLKGGFIRYCDQARYYVEQVTTAKQLWKQQRRWRTGQLDCLRKYFKPVFLSVFKEGRKDSISLLILLMIPVMCLLFLFQTITLPVLIGELAGYRFVSPVAVLAGFAANTGVMCILYSIALMLDGLFSFKLWKGILAAAFAPYFYGIIDLTSLIIPMKEWNPILHGQSKWFLAKNNPRKFKWVDKKKGKKVLEKNK